jgi:hypothetical protein
MKRRQKKVSKDENKAVSPQDLKAWMESLYQIDEATDLEVMKSIEEFKYIGFDRQAVLTELFNLNLDRNILKSVIVVTALRGPTNARKLLVAKWQVLNTIPLRSVKGKNGLSFSRITSATADLAAYYLKKAQIHKRLPGEACPSWLQFPSAGSIKLPERLREQHLSFSKAFSLKIKGEFNSDIYTQMVENSYVDDNLKLFSDIVIE